MKKNVKTVALVLAFLAAAVIMRSAAYAAVSSRTVTEDERRLMTSAVAVGFSGEPFAAQVAVAGVLLDRDNDTVADAIAYFAERGEIPPVAHLYSADAPPKAYRVALDAVDTALAGCRPAGEVTSFERVPEKKLKMSVDFVGAEAEDDNVIGGIRFD